MFALPGQRGRGGQLFCTITLHRSGLATRFLVTDLFFRPLFAFFIVELKSRRVIHVGVTGSPTDAWVAQQLREATPMGKRRNLSFVITIANSGPLSRAWPQPAASRY